MHGAPNYGMTNCNNSADTKELNIFIEFTEHNNIPE